MGRGIAEHERQLASDAADELRARIGSLEASAAALTAQAQQSASERDGAASEADRQRRAAEQRRQELSDAAAELASVRAESDGCRAELGRVRHERDEAAARAAALQASAGELEGEVTRRSMARRAVEGEAHAAGEGWREAEAALRARLEALEEEGARVRLEHASQLAARDEEMASTQARAHGTPGHPRRACKRAPLSTHAEHA